MGIIEQAVTELETLLEGTGCEDGAVVLSVDPDIDICQFEQGACMVAEYGGKTAEFVTFEPTRAKTRISFMFGVIFTNQGMRSAACAIINAVTGFLCISRIRHACKPECHEICAGKLKEQVKGKKIFIFGQDSKFLPEFKSQLVGNPSEAEILIVTGDGLTSGDNEDLIGKEVPGKELLLIGPSTSGIAALGNYHQWCPHGRG